MINKTEIEKLSKRIFATAIEKAIQDACNRYFYSNVDDVEHGEELILWQPFENTSDDELEELKECFCLSFRVFIECNKNNLIAKFLSEVDSGK